MGRVGRLYTYKGQSKTIKEWSDELGILANTINHRIRAGVPIDKEIKPLERDRGYSNKKRVPIKTDKRMLVRKKDGCLWITSNVCDGEIDDVVQKQPIKLIDESPCKSCTEKCKKSCAKFRDWFSASWSIVRGLYGGIHK